MNEILNKKILRKLKDKTFDELIELDKGLNSLYNQLNFKCDVENFVSNFEKITKQENFKQYSEFEKIIDSCIAPFSDNILKRNINIIKVAIEQRLIEISKIKINCV
jgi:enolase